MAMEGGVLAVPLRVVVTGGGRMQAAPDFGEPIQRATGVLFAGVGGRILGRGEDSARYAWSFKPSRLLR